MKKIILFLTFLSFSLFAQKAIELKPGGEIFPRVSLTSTTDNSTVGSPTLSQMVYNTNAALADGVGYYFWNGSNWTKLGAGTAGTLPSTAIVLSETATNTPLQTAGFLNSGKAMIPFQGWEKTLDANNEFTNKEAKEDYAYQSNSQLTDYKYWVFWGGLNSSNVFQNNGKYYNFLTNTWTSLPAPPSGFDPRRRHSLTALTDNIIIWGGQSSTASSTALGTGAKLVLNENGAGAWTLLSNTNAPDARFGHSAVPFYDVINGVGNGIIVWGGVNSSNSLLHSGKIWKSSTNWEVNNISTTNDPQSRYLHYAFSTRGRFNLNIWTIMFIWGGQGAGGFLNTGGFYNSNTDSWTAISNSNAPVNDNDVSITHIGTTILVYGGGNNGTGGGGKFWTSSTDTWTNMSSLNAPKLKQHSAVTTSINGVSYMYLWGGYIDDGSATPNDKIWTYDITNDKWLEPADFQTGVTPTTTYKPFITTFGEQIGVYGGNNSGGTFQAVGGVFNPLKLKPYYLFKKQ